MKLIMSIHVYLVSVVSVDHLVGQKLLGVKIMHLKLIKQVNPKEVEILCFYFSFSLISLILFAINEGNKLKCYSIITIIGLAMSYSTNARGKSNK